MHVRMRLRRHAVRLPACRPSFGAGGIDPKYIQLVGVWGPPPSLPFCVWIISKGEEKCFSFPLLDPTTIYIMFQNKTKQNNCWGPICCLLEIFFLMGEHPGGACHPHKYIN